MDGRLVWMPIPVPRRRSPVPEGDVPAKLRAPLETDETERLRAVVGGRSRADAQVAHHLEVMLAHYRLLNDLIGPSVR